MQPYAKVLENTQEGDIGTCAYTHGQQGPPKKRRATRVGLDNAWPGGSRGFTEAVVCRGLEGWAALEK